VSLAGIEGRSCPVNEGPFRFQGVDGVWPIARYQLDYRPCAIDNATVRPVVQHQFESLWFDGNESRLLRKLFLGRYQLMSQGSQESYLDTMLVCFQVSEPERAAN